MAKAKAVGGGSIDEEEMDALIAAHDWTPYRLEMKDCRDGKDRHHLCPGRRQPTNHIDPHPTVCICECHPWNVEEIEWEDDEADVEWDELTPDDESEVAWEDVPD